MMRRPPRSTQSRSSAASDVYKRQELGTYVQAGRRGEPPLGTAGGGDQVDIEVAIPLPRERQELAVRGPPVEVGGPDGRDLPGRPAVRGDRVHDGGLAAAEPERLPIEGQRVIVVCLLYTSDAADDLLCVDLGGRRIIKKK